MSTDATPETVEREEYGGIPQTREILVAVLASAAGVVAMSPLLLAAYRVGAISAESFARLGAFPGYDPSLAVGVAVFLLGAGSVIPLLFVSLGEFLPPERSVPLRGVSYGTVVWSGFVVAFYEGQAGLAFVAFVGLTLLAHWVYGYVLGLLYDMHAELATLEV